MDTLAGFHDAQGRHGGVILPARPEPIAFDPAATALIVVDVQNAYASPGGYLDLAGFDAVPDHAAVVLGSILRARGVNTLVFTGIATNVCVESTLRDGYHREYFGIVLADATHQAGPRSLHEGALANIETFFGWVSDVAAFEQALTAQTRAAAE